MRRFLQRLDPRRHVTAALGWAIFAVVTAAALLAANIAADAAEDRVRADSGRLLAQLAQETQRALAAELATRLAIVEVAASQIAASGDRSHDALRRHLDAIGRGFPEFVWLGVADATGRVLAATGGALEGDDVSQLPWFRAGQRAPRLGAVHEVAAWAETRGAGAPLRVLDAAAPLRAPDGSVRGVVGAYLPWSWVERLQMEVLHSIAQGRGIDLVLAARDGLVLSGPAPWRGRSLRNADGTTPDLSEGGTYLVRLAGLKDSADALEPRWTVAVRQRADVVLADARSIQHAVFAVVLAAGLLAAAAASAVARRLLARLVRLADDARAVQRGVRGAVAPPEGRDEIAGIGATLAGVVADLHHETRALQALNAELDARVAQRTARIERMAGEQKQAAVVRERLRLARDLHDTLAHSLMALLTQIRLVRKLRHRLEEPELEAELARAEEVATTGLAEARAAIAQMRHNAVSDSGLGEAVRELLTRFSQRTGIEHTLRVDDAAGALAGERAETVFRIVEEALHNTERHARAGHVQLTLAGADMAAANGAALRFRLEVVDDGVGFDPTQERQGHYGLRGMREQAALIEAQLRIASAPGAGTRLTLEFEA